MQIQTCQAANSYVLRLAGRLDANWAEYVGKAIESAIHAGQHSIDLDLAQVDYLSSAGIRILVKFYGQLKAAQGRLCVQNATPNVLSVLKLSGLVGLLVTAGEAEASPSNATGPSTVSPAQQSHRWEQDGLVFERYPQAANQSLACRFHGSPARFATGELVAEQSIVIPLDQESGCLGVGAFGSSAQDVQGRFGESLAVAGVAVTQPSDGSSVPDFQLAHGELVPEIRLLYGLSWHGRFPFLLRFEAGQSERGTLGLSRLVDAAMKDLRSPAAAFAILAESDAVIGAHILRSPANAAGSSPWTFPAVRDWLSFTTEQSDDRNLVLIAGVAMDAPTAEQAQFLRPFGLGPKVLGHFHAAVFPYRPVAKGQVDLSQYANDLLATEAVQAVMHLVADDREFDGCGETALSRGACWYGPLRLVD